MYWGCWNGFLFITMGRVGLRNECVTRVVMVKLASQGNYCIIQDVPVF